MILEQVKDADMTARQFRALKRAQLGEVIKAWDIYWCGSGYCPFATMETRWQIHAALLKLREALSVRNWGRG